MHCFRCIFLQTHTKSSASDLKSGYFTQMSSRNQRWKRPSVGEVNSILVSAVAPVMVFVMVCHPLVEMSAMSTVVAPSIVPPPVMLSLMVVMSGV